MLTILINELKSGNNTVFKGRGSKIIKEKFIQ